MKLRSFFSGLLIAVFAFLLLGAGEFYWIAAQSPLALLSQGMKNIPNAAMFVSKQAPAMVSLLVNPDKLEQFWQVVARPQERRRSRQELTQFKRSLLANTGLEYERDVKPWLGDEITIAVTTLDFDRDLLNGKQPGYLLAISTKDPERSREFLQLFWQKRAIAGNDLTFEQYQGVKLIYAAVPTGKKHAEEKLKQDKRKAFDSIPDDLFPIPALASAVVGDQFVLFANHPKVLRDAITNVQAVDLNLNNAKPYAQALDTLTQPRIGLTVVNLPQLTAWLEGSTLESTVKATGKAQAANVLDMKKAVIEPKYSTLAIALGLNPLGLMADTALLTADGSSTSKPSLTQPVAALQYLPAASLFSLLGTHLDSTWSSLSKDLAGYQVLSKLLDQPLDAVRSRWQLDLEKDVFDWVKGDYALGLLPNFTVEPVTNAKSKRQPISRRTPNLPTNDWIFIAERPTGEADKQAIAHLDDLAKTQGLSVGSLPLGDQMVSAWTRLTPSSGKNQAKTLQAEVQGVHTTVGNYELFTTSIETMDRVLKTGGNSLKNSDRFEQAIAPLLQPNNGYVYLDWTEGKAVLERQFPILKIIELVGKPLFNHLQSLSLSSYGMESGVQHSGVFLKLE
ncbi:DUF3352 domain-containing protein [Phormidium sp. CLA17]|uniref:DUF3352 domain-containing protein n=1 Tax=Leptolyngbya sp. Cla-17 TaxID=2803751 RepID=UPI0014922B61|nr:DUF3352 domain-containing protein [Leptolyngbya sp. Cla-17]MBM0742015.1 DUF3352 domain-containing protein [Leptolyngbya sp. Cla-17]